MFPEQNCITQTEPHLTSTISAKVSLFVFVIYSLTCTSYSTGQLKNTVSSRLYAQFWTARIPLFASYLILNFVVTQCKTMDCNDAHPLFHPNLNGNALRVYVRGYSFTDVKFNKKITNPNESQIYVQRCFPPTIEPYPQYYS